MQYQVDPTDQSRKNGQKPCFWLFGSFKHTFLWHLNGPSWPINLAEGWRTSSAITICNIISIQQTWVKKMTKNLYFGSLDHSKIHFCEFWMILYERYYSPVVSTIKISSMKHIRPAKLKKIAKNLYFGSLDHSKMHFFDFWMIQHDQKLLTPFSTIIICNMKSIRPTKLEKLTKDWRDHSKFIRVARKRS